MKSPFRSQYRITQGFGENAEYYRKFNLRAHEGIDLIPSGSVWDVYALADGVVVLDDDVVGSVIADPYGKIVTIWHPTLNKATMYCHLSENTVVQGQQVKAGEKIGVMGSTGNSSGAHLHLNLFETDANGTRLNRNNGYNGGIDPLTFLQAEDKPAPVVTVTDTSDTAVKKQIIIDVYKGLTGEFPNEDEIKARLAQNKNTTELIEDIGHGDSRFYDKWIAPYIGHALSPETHPKPAALPTESPKTADIPAPKPAVEQLDPEVRNALQEVLDLVLSFLRWKKN